MVKFLIPLFIYIATQIVKTAKLVDNNFALEPNHKVKMSFIQVRVLRNGQPNKGKARWAKGRRRWREERGRREDLHKAAEETGRVHNENPPIRIGLSLSKTDELSKQKEDPEIRKVEIWKILDQVWNAAWFLSQGTEAFGWENAWWTSLVLR